MFKRMTKGLVLVLTAVLILGGGSGQVFAYDIRIQSTLYPMHILTRLGGGRFLPRSTVTDHRLISFSPRGTTKTT